jgi:hypothetical protein
MPDALTAIAPALKPARPEGMPIDLLRLSATTAFYISPNGSFITFNVLFENNEH